MQLLNAQSDLSSQVQELRRNGSSEVLTAAEAQLSELSSVQQRLASGTISVAALRSEVTATVTAAIAIAGQVRAATTASALQADLALRTASADARRTVDAFVTDFYEKKIFDPYLRFASAEDEAAYREREAERQRAITTAQAENTPEGDLRAVALARAQLKDAGAHGAAGSPDYQPMVDNLDRAHASLDAQLRPASRTYDPLDEVAPAVTADASILAALRDAGVTTCDTSQRGHGVNHTIRDCVAVVRT